MYKGSGLLILPTPNMSIPIGRSRPAQQVPTSAERRLALRATASARALVGDLFASGRTAANTYKADQSARLRTLVSRVLARRDVKSLT